MNILDPRFKYVPAAQTDIRKLFAKVRREQEAKKKAQAEKVTPIARRKS